MTYIAKIMASIALYWKGFYLRGVQVYSIERSFRAKSTRTTRVHQRFDTVVPLVLNSISMAMLKVLLI